MFASAEFFHDRVAVFQRVQARGFPIDYSFEKGRDDTRGVFMVFPQASVVAVGQDAIAEEEDQPAAFLDVSRQGQGLAGGELCHVAKEDAVVFGQIQFQKRAFRYDFWAYESSFDLAFLRRQGDGQIGSGAAVAKAAAGRASIDTKDR